MKFDKKNFIEYVINDPLRDIKLYLPKKDKVAPAEFICWMVTNSWFRPGDVLKVEGIDDYVNGSYEVKSEADGTFKLLKTVVV